MNYLRVRPIPAVGPINSQFLMLEASSNRLFSIPMFVSLVLASSLACAASKDARPTPGVEEIQPAGPPFAVAAPQGVAGAASSTPSTPKAASSTASSPGKDSTAKDPPITVPSVKGRTKKDSLALVKAVTCLLYTSDAADE